MVKIFTYELYLQFLEKHGIYVASYLTEKKVKAGAAINRKVLQWFICFPNNPRHYH